MLRKMYAVYDSKSETYDLPAYFRTRGEAVRAFASSCNDSNSPYFKYSADFTLFELGEYDDGSASFNLHSTPISCGLAQEFVVRDDDVR